MRFRPRKLRRGAPRFVPSGRCKNQIPIIVVWLRPASAPVFPVSPAVLRTPQMPDPSSLHSAPRTRLPWPCADKSNSARSSRPPQTTSPAENRIARGRPPSGLAESIRFASPRDRIAADPAPTPAGTRKSTLRISFLRNTHIPDCYRAPPCRFAWQSLCDTPGWPCRIFSADTRSCRYYSPRPRIADRPSPPSRNTSRPCLDPSIGAGRCPACSDTPDSGATGPPASCTFPPPRGTPCAPSKDPPSVLPSGPAAPGWRATRRRASAIAECAPPSATRDFRPESVLRRVLRVSEGECLLEPPLNAWSWRISLLRLRLSLVGVLLLAPKDTKNLLQWILFLFPWLPRGIRGSLPGRVRRPVGIVIRHCL